MTDTNDTTASRDAITARNTKESPLLHLPGEIRNVVYKYVLSNSGGFFIHGIKGTDSKLVKSGRKNLLALLATCRVVYPEAKFLPFSLNTFKFEVSDREFLLFCFELGTTRRKDVRSVYVTGRIASVHQIVKATRKYGFQSLSEVFPGLQRVGMYMGDYTGPGGGIAEYVYEDIMSWVQSGLQDYVEQEVFGAGYLPLIQTRSEGQDDPL